MLWPPTHGQWSRLGRWQRCPTRQSPRQSNSDAATDPKDLRWQLYVWSRQLIFRLHLPSLQNLPWLAGSWRKENFCRSAYVSASRPTINMPVPVESNVVMPLTAWGWVWRELIIMTGSETTNTQMACTSRKKKNEKSAFKRVGNNSLAAVSMTSLEAI